MEFISSRVFSYSSSHLADIENFPMKVRLFIQKFNITLWLKISLFGEVKMTIFHKVVESVKLSFTSIKNEETIYILKTKVSIEYHSSKNVINVRDVRRG